MMHVQMEVRYVLMVPYTEPSRKVVWIFSAKFDEYKGDVFVLELDFFRLLVGAHLGLRNSLAK